MSDLPPGNGRAVGLLGVSTATLTSARTMLTSIATTGTDLDLTRSMAPTSTVTLYRCAL